MGGLCVGVGEPWHDSHACAVCNPPLPAGVANALLQEIRAVVVLADGEDAMTVRRRIARILDRGICRECGGTPESCRHSTAKCCPDCTHTVDILNAGGEG